MFLTVEDSHDSFVLIAGETPAAMQHGGSTNNAKFHCVTTFLLIIWILDQFR